MRTEDKLKDLIEIEFDSLSNFSKVCDVPYSTIRSILQRGLGTATLSNFSKICDTLRISAEELRHGNIVTTYKPNRKKPVEITDILALTKQQLLNNEALMFNGKPASEESIQSILSAMEVGMELAKKNNK